MTFSKLTRAGAGGIFGFSLAGAALITAALAAGAEDVLIEADVDGDGFVTLEELLAAYPDVTEESFIAMDTNADGALDQDELTVAMDAGLLIVEDEDA